MNFVRTFHRWVSAAFTLTFLANLVAMALSGGQQPPAWVTYSPLLPLLLLLGTGLPMLVQPLLKGSKEK
ncbi:MAG: hypothetical protein GQE15_28735 [Archangiaceae bacterium]|nr:hypothetical protein [Archangiaceae bacterium]